MGRKLRKGRQHRGIVDHEESLVHWVELMDDGRLKVEVRVIVTVDGKCWNDVVEVVLDPED